MDYLRSLAMLAALGAPFCPLSRANNIILSVSGCTIGCTTSPFGMVSLQQDIDSISVDVSVTLDSDANGPYHFHGASDPHHFALAFNITGSPAVTINILTAGFSLAGAEPGSYSVSPFGTFDYALRCTGCGTGYAGGLSGPLQIKVTPSVGILTTSSFLPSGAPNFFSVDIVDFLGNSGNVADPGDPNPEPTPMLLIGGGLIGLGALARKKGHRPL